MAELALEHGGGGDFCALQLFWRCFTVKEIEEKRLSWWEELTSGLHCRRVKRVSVWGYRKNTAERWQIPSSPSDKDSSWRVSGTLVCAVWFRHTFSETRTLMNLAPHLTHTHTQNTGMIFMPHLSFYLCEDAVKGLYRGRHLTYPHRLTCPGTRSWSLGRWFCVFPMCSINEKETI